jgi:hypothetical protein
MAEGAVPDMMRRRSGHIAIVSSPVGLSGFVGFGSYAPTKVCLLSASPASVAESELRISLPSAALLRYWPTNSMALASACRLCTPATPTRPASRSAPYATLSIRNSHGLQAENLTKPPETKELSDVGALQSAESVARSAVLGIAERRFHVPTDLISRYCTRAAPWFHS